MGTPTAAWTTVAKSTTRSTTTAVSGRATTACGVREVHCNTMQGRWVGLRNFFRPFRRVSKWCLDLYVSFYQGLHNDRRDCRGFLRLIVGPFTPKDP